MISQTRESFASTRHLLLAALTVAFMCSPGLPRLARAADGDLDATFGNGGKVTTDFNFSNDQAFAVAIQPDGKLVVAGVIFGRAALGDADFAVARYQADGSLDDTFGAGGKVETDFSNSYDFAAAVAIQSDGKIVVAGSTDNALLGTEEFGVVRYNPDGSLDTSFGDGGKVHTSFGSPLRANGAGVAVQSDGKIVVVGNAFTGETGGFALARYNADGSLDATFGTGGKVTTDVEAGSVSSGVAVAIQNDGKIVAAGTARLPGASGDTRFAVVRYADDGSLDASFGSGGTVDVGFGGSREVGFALALQLDGKIVVAGFTTLTGNEQFAVARYNDDGTPDATFGSGGLATTDWGGSNTVAYGVGIQADGKIVIAGSYFSTVTPGFFDFGVSRYNADGTLDTSFGTNGLTTTDFQTTRDIANGLALQDDGRIVVVGSTSGINVPGGVDFALARYEGPQQ